MRSLKKQVLSSRPPEKTVAFSSSQTAKPHPETVLKLDRGLSARIDFSNLLITQDDVTRRKM